MSKYKINNEKIHNIFGSYEMIDIATTTLCRIDLESIDDGCDTINNIFNAVDDTIIYYNIQWEIMKHYQNPKDANLDEAINDFLYDLNLCIEEV